MGGVMGCERNDTTVAICITILLYQLQRAVLHKHNALYSAQLFRVTFNRMHCPQRYSE